MEQFKRFGIDLERDNYTETSIYGVAFVYTLLEKEIENALKPFSLSPSKFNMLMIIKHQGKEDGISQVEVGKRLVVTASNMTKMIDKLVNEGLVERSARQGDRRVNLVKITQKGSDLLDQAWPDYFKTVTELADLISEEERKTLSTILAKWFEKLENFKD